MPLKASLVLLGYQQITTSVNQMVPLSPEIVYAASKIVQLSLKKLLTAERLIMRKNSTIHGTLLLASGSFLSLLGRS